MTALTLAEISLYPIKSTAGIQLSSAWIDELGLSFDRRFVVADLQGKCITARTVNKLCLVQANLTATGLIVTAPNMGTLVINYCEFSTYKPVTVWGDVTQGQFCSDKAANWFSEYLQRPCQLLFFGEDSVRIRQSKTTKVSRKVAFTDGYPLLLISSASLADLNNKLNDNATPSQVTMSQFRPNLVVDNCTAFAEDNWRKIKIGQVEFTVVKACERCVFTTINPATGERNKNKEPLKTLAGYRKCADNKIIFGQNLIALNPGQIKLGDEIEIIT